MCCSARLAALSRRYVKPVLNSRKASVSIMIPPRYAVDFPGKQQLLQATAANRDSEPARSQPTVHRNFQARNQACANHQVEAAERECCTSSHLPVFDYATDLSD